MGIQVSKSDNSESFKADQVPQVIERGPSEVSAKLAKSNHPSKSIKALSSWLTYPDQF